MSQFTIGQVVTARQFVDCFGKHHAAVDDLVVERIRLVDTVSIPAYYRIFTRHQANPWHTVEGAEHFFQEITQ